MSKTGNAKTESVIWHNEEMTRIGICNFGWKSSIGSFPMALVTFVDATDGGRKSHQVRPYLRQTDGMAAAQRYAETGEIPEDTE